jgi:uncharacterized protein involved in type VI secretion and phage assembly
MVFDRVRSWLRSGPAACEVTTATVVDNVDPASEGRVMVEGRPGHGGAGRRWARLATLMAGPDRGTWFIPDVGDEVLVAFEHGDRRRPIVIGSLWSAQARPPEQIGANNGRRSIVTRSGARIVIDDTSGDSVIRLETANGQHVTLDDGAPNSVTISDQAGNTIELSAAGVSVAGAASVELAAAGTVTVSAARISLQSGIVDVSGTLKCSTMIADSVIAASYTPGAGNVW